MYKEKPPAEGQLRFNTTIVDKFRFGNYKRLKTTRILQQYDGHEWKDIPEYYSQSITV